MYIPGTQMTLVLNGKGLLLEGSNPKIEDKQVPGIDTCEYSSGFLLNLHQVILGTLLNLPPEMERPPTLL